MMRPSLIKPGDRVMMSNLGRRRHPGYADLEGTIVGRSAYPSSVRVKFEGRKQVETFHRDYLELVHPTGTEDRAGLQWESRKG